MEPEEVVRGCAVLPPPAACRHGLDAPEDAAQLRLLFGVNVVEPYGAEDTGASEGADEGTPEQHQRGAETDEDGSDARHGKAYTHRDAERHCPHQNTV